MKALHPIYQYLVNVTFLLHEFNGTAYPVATKAHYTRRSTVRRDPETWGGEELHKVSLGMAMSWTRGNVYHQSDRLT